VWPCSKHHSLAAQMLHLWPCSKHHSWPAQIIHMLRQVKLDKAVALGTDWEPVSQNETDILLGLSGQVRRNRTHAKALRPHQMLVW